MDRPVIRALRGRRRLVRYGVALGAALWVAGQPGPASGETGRLPAVLSGEAAHARMMAELGMTSIRRGADGDPNAEHAANYDESRANADLDSLPALLEDDDGASIDSAGDWRRTRRPELLEHFAREIYGRVPAELPGVDWRAGEVVEEKLGEFAVHTQAVDGRIRSPVAPALDTRIPVTLSWPRTATGPVPIVLEIAFAPEFIEEIRARLGPERFAALAGGGTPWREQVLARGWAVASFDAGKLQADDSDGLQRGIIGLANAGQPRQPGDWGALRAWAWGVSRIVDYLARRAEFDASRVAVFGHSRFGKAALVAMAMDERIAAGFISSSGEGGAKLWRRNFGEQIGNIAGAGEYHWVAGNFIRYAGPLTARDLPVDAHALIALCAPRPVFISAGDEGDEWTDPKGMFLAAAYASPVYELLEAGGLGRQEYPPIGTLLDDGALAFRQHDLGHTPGPNWPFFLDFAARYFAAQ